MSMHNPKCPSCDGTFGSRTAFCNDINPVHEDCFYMIQGIKHSHVFCANPFCHAKWIEIENKLTKPLALKMIKVNLRKDKKVKHG
jgi:hypothetical protein